MNEQKPKDEEREICIVCKKPVAPGVRMCERCDMIARKNVRYMRKSYRSRRGGA